MKILHYSLGFPPYRTGGMTKYCMDLMIQQATSGDEVSLLWPGHYEIISNSTRIRKAKKYKLNNILTCKSFEMVNPMPVPLLDGILDVEKFCKEIDARFLTLFFEKNRFDVLHIHTLMGLPKEVLQIAKQKNINILFTTHDYFGLCTKCNFTYGNLPCPDSMNCSYCKSCNLNALSFSKMKMLQSKFYKKIKTTSIIKKLRKGHISAKLEKINATIIDESQKDVLYGEKYQKLRNYYCNMFELCNTVHCNSTITKEIFDSYLADTNKNIVVNISNNEIYDRKKIKNYNNKKLRIGYLGPYSVRKGFSFLIDCLDDIYKYTSNFTLTVYNSFSDRDYIISNEPYNYSQLENVMNGIDVLIVPSIWNETFGFTVLEALSFGVPVIVSDKVGAKDLIVNEETGYIYKTSDELKNIITKIIDDREILVGLNSNIMRTVHIKTMQEHSEELRKLYFV